jgi:hypothetical protein
MIEIWVAVLVIVCLVIGYLWGQNSNDDGNYTGGKK